VFSRRNKQRKLTDVAADDPDIHCADEASARAEAARRQAEEADDGVEWIYLHRDRDDQWVARRYTGDVGAPEAEGRTSRVMSEVIGELIDPTTWIN